MPGNGYLEDRSKHPRIMMGVVAIHVAGLTGLIMFAPEVSRTIDRVLTVESIPLPDTPRPIPPVRKLATRQLKPDARPQTPDPSFDAFREIKVGLTEIVRDDPPVDGSGPGNETIIDRVDLPKEPVLISATLVGGNAQPPYPSDMQRLAVEGRVVVRVLVSEAGVPVRVEALDVDRPSFFEATRRWAMRHWRFSPATRDGVPVEAWRTMTVRFTLNN